MALRDNARAPQGLLNKRVVVTGEVEVCGTMNGAHCFLGILHLLPRFCLHVRVVLPAGLEALLERGRAVVNALGFGAFVSFEIGVASEAEADAYLSVGRHLDTRMPMTVVNSNGWTARVSSREGSLPGGCGQFNPVAALAAACLGCAEVFKRLVDLVSSRGTLLPPTSLSLFSLKLDDDVGPALPEAVELDLLLAGLGAIGNGVAYLLRQLAVRGRVQLVDNQSYGIENIGTSILVGFEHLGARKAEAARVWLQRDGLEVTSFVGTVSELANSYALAFRPRVVLGALDNVEARHELQRLFWPDLLIDGAIGEFEVQVSRHGWPGPTACLMCVFPRVAGPRAETVQAQETGLATARVIDADDVVREEDVQKAPVEKQSWLRARIGKQICSVVNEAIMANIARDQSAQVSRPSVPFVACMSSCIVVSELLKEAMGAPSELDPRFAFDLLQGPRQAQFFAEDRHADCECTTRRQEIDLFRQIVTDSSRSSF